MNSVMPGQAPEPKACDVHVWDGGYRMNCGLTLVDGRCMRHGDSTVRRWRARTARAGDRQVGREEQQVSETAGVVVIDQNGRSHHYDADDFRDDGAYLEIVKGTERVARFAPGYIGVYKAAAEHVPAMSGLRT